MPRLPIAVVIPTRNEAANIVSTVRSVIAHFTAVVVVDSESTDDTRELAKAEGAEVIGYTWDGGYPKKKQWCLDRVRTDIDWVLFLDGDETPSGELLAELRRIFLDGRPVRPAAFDIPLGYWFAGRRLRHGHTIVKRALLDRTRARFPEPADLAAPGMGEQEGHYQPLAEPVYRLRAPIEHRDLDPVRTWFERHNRYSDWEAWLECHPAVREEIRLAKTRQGQLFHRAPLKPLLSFGYAYLYRRGFLDGRAGLDYALAMSFYRWQIGLKTREARAAAPPEAAPLAGRDAGAGADADADADAGGGGGTGGGAGVDAGVDAGGGTGVGGGAGGGAGPGLDAATGAGSGGRPDPGA